MKKSGITIRLLTVVIIICFISCGKQIENKPLKETQIYGAEKHLPARKLLSYLPQPDALALVSPSLGNIIYSFFKINNFRNNEISNSLKKDPTWNFVIKEDKEKTIENLKSLGANINSPCAFFYTLDDKWEAVIAGENTNSLQKIFPNAKKTTLRTSWFWFISGKLSAYWDSKLNIGFTEHNGYIFLSNSIELLTRSISGNTVPPSFHYGLEGKPVISPDETVILLSLSDDLKAILNNPKQPFEPVWLKALLLVLGTEYDEICAVINPEDSFHEIAIAIHSQQKPSNNPSIPVLQAFNFMPDNTMVKFDLAITNGLKSLLMELPRRDSSGQLKKSLGRISGFINSPLFQDELSIGISPPTEGDMPGVILITMCNQINTLKSLLGIAGVSDEPMGEFEVIKADLEKLTNIPLTLFIGLKSPHVVITNNKDQLSQVVEKITQLPQEESNQTMQNACPYGFFFNDTNAIDAFFTNNPVLLEIEVANTLSKILPKIPEMCMYNNDAWYLLKIKATI
ncbi:MAG: hypothetical protein ACP5UA_10870 [Candidatus Hydrogenedens sp.]